MTGRSTLLFAGGGTGGHVYPLLAVADAVAALAPGTRCVFAGTERGMEKDAVPARGYELELVSVRPMRGGGPLRALGGAWSALGALPASRALLRRLDPRAVLSIGGYAAGPIALAARLGGRPLALLEPNSEIGLSNKLIAPFADRAYTAFPETARHFACGVVLETGVPIRAGFAPAPYARHPSELAILVFGGSQGAESLNQNLPRALARLDLPIRVVHQAGAGKEAETRALYAELGLGERVHVVPFIAEVAAAIAAADLVIGRAGAGAVSEIAAVGRPSILVPYPHAGDHQRRNAESLERRNAAVCVLAEQATPERLAREIERLAGDAGRLDAMARAAQALGRPEAARRIAEDLLELAGIGAGAQKPSPFPVASEAH